MAKTPPETFDGTIENWSANWGDDQEFVTGELDSAPFTTERVTEHTQEWAKCEGGMNWILGARMNAIPD